MGEGMLRSWATTVLLLLTATLASCNDNSEESLSPSLLSGVGRPSTAAVRTPSAATAGQSEDRALAALLREMRDACPDNAPMIAIAATADLRPKSGYWEWAVRLSADSDSLSRAKIYPDGAVTGDLMVFFTLLCAVR